MVKLWYRHSNTMDILMGNAAYSPLLPKDFLDFSLKAIVHSCALRDHEFKICSWKLDSCTP